MTSTTTEWCWTRSRRRCRPVSSTRCSPTPSTKASSSAAPTTASWRSASSACPKTRCGRCPTRSSCVFSFRRLLAVGRHFGGLQAPCWPQNGPCVPMRCCACAVMLRSARRLPGQPCRKPGSSNADTAGVRGGAGDYRPSGWWQARSSKARPHPPRIAGVAGAPGSPHAEGALSSGAACPVAREFGGRWRCCTDPRDRVPAACEIAGRIRVGV